jgi:ABC-type sugar transport system permease subunit
VILFLAGLQKLDKTMYEAAQIDGASAWETFWKITLPSLKSIILVSAIYTVVTLATFSNNPIILFISRAMFDPTKGYGYASALAWIYFMVIVILLVIVTILIVPKEQGYRVIKQIERLKR